MVPARAEGHRNGEEKILENKFGERYLEYKKLVRRWI
jgi:protein-S-isoprenylcysteine O-methyltransferase Ste14